MRQLAAPYALYIEIKITQNFRGKISNVHFITEVNDILYMTTFVVGNIGSRFTSNRIQCPVTKEISNQYKYKH